MIEQMKHEMFAQNLKNMGVLWRDMDATKKVMKQFNDHFCPRFCQDGQYCPLSGYPSLVTCSNDGECTYCMVGIFERLIEHLEPILKSDTLRIISTIVDKGVTPNAGNSLKG